MWSVPGTPADLARCVVAAQQGDEAAFDTLYVTVQPGLLRYLRGLVGQDAEDVASEAWLHIVRDLPGLRDTSGFRGWAATIARNRALDHLRHHKRRPAVATPIEDLAQLPTQHPDPGDEAIEAVSTDAALALIASLPRDQAEAVLLRVVVGLDTAARSRCSWLAALNCHAIAAADPTSITESRPKATSAVDDATAPALIAAIASITL
jgi:RNA polymerase sigma-70 factor (ECF subfamily)